MNREEENRLWQEMIAQGRIVKAEWPGGSGGMPSAVLGNLATEILFGNVKPEFTCALVAFARGLHAVVLAQQPEVPHASQG